MPHFLQQMFPHFFAETLLANTFFYHYFPFSGSIWKLWSRPFHNKCTEIMTISIMSSLIVSCRDNIWHATKFIAMVGLRDNTNSQFQGPIILGFFWAAPEVHNQESLNTFSRNERQLHKYYPSHNYQRNVFKCIYIFFSLPVIFFIYFIDYVNSTRTPKEKYIFTVVSSCSNTDIWQVMNL